MHAIQIFAIIFSVGLVAGIVDLIRRGMLKEQYALLWLVSAIVLLVLSVLRRFLDAVALAVGVAYPPALLFLVAFLFLLLIVLHFSVIISELSEKNKRLSQEIAILKTLFEQYLKTANHRGHGDKN